ncbi:sensor histidine kinase [Pontibacter oryzae]|uniref:histidine kinase n=1 Tax=Pontibacter oryzae TaxID=2304593 RepID=A0A399RTC9_9BACT|nr:ATP-binding protein [Pontibacter oryzae]RIJ34121.1 GAF domain-containing protein [Pontibacter oryzae]
MVTEGKDTQTEQKRLVALKDYKVLDTPAEQEFDELTQLASQICGTPISLITLIDEHRQWFKSKLGISLPETPRSVSFCEYAIKENEIFEITDATKDERFKHNPLVTNSPKIRFYAGSQLVTANGHNLGTLCVIDTIPRRLTMEQKYALKVLAKQVITNFELRQKQKQLELEKKQLQKANEKLDQFVHMVSHDLKEPIMNMQAVSEWILEDLNERDYANLGSNLSLMQERISAMGKIVNGLLEYSMTNVKDLPKQETDIGQLVQQILKEQEKAKDFTVSITDAMPTLFTEKILIQQVLTNLISNAIKYHDTGHGNLSIGFEQADHMYAFYVQDDGPGIAPEHHQRIFGLYERLLRDTSRSKGTGIGLATVKKIVEEKGGKVWVNSELGQGARFSFTWPK